METDSENFVARLNELSSLAQLVGHRSILSCATDYLKKARYIEEFCFTCV